MGFFEDLLFVKNRVPLFKLLSLALQKALWGVENFDGLNDDVFLGFVVCVGGGFRDGDGCREARCDFPEDCMLVVEVWCGGHGDKELATVGVGARIGHGEHPRFGMGERGVEFVGECVAGAASAGSCGVAALNHKAWDDAVELDSVIVSPLGEVDEVGNRQGCSGGKEAQSDRALICLDDGLDVLDFCA